MEEPQEAAGKGKPAGILRWVTLTVVAFHVSLWLVSIGVLVSQVGAVESEFAEHAMREHGGYVVMNTLAILVGYLIISALFVFLLYPMVSFWLRKKDQPTRRAIIWRTMVCLLVVTGGFFARMMALRPYHINQWFETYTVEIDATNSSGTSVKATNTNTSRIRSGSCGTISTV